MTVDMAASSLAGKRLQILAISPFLAQYSSMSRNLLLLAQKSRHLLTLLAPENANLVLQAGYVPLPNIALRAASSRFNKGRTGTEFRR